jgi:xanthine dehydrogenase accessory factor
MTQLFQTLYDRLQQGRPAVLATVISSKGSLPMSERAKMLVFQDGSIRGTVGGGIIEASVIQEALRLFDNRMPKVLDLDLTSAQIEDEGMTCGGTVGIFLEYFSPEDTLDLVQQLAQVYSRSEHAVVATALPPAQSESGANTESWRIILTKDGRLSGTSGNESLDLRLRKTLHTYFEQPMLGMLSVELSPEESHHGNRKAENSLPLFVETLLPTPTAYLFGGGHVSQHLAKILQFIGFEYVVLDDRQEFLTRELFPHAKDFVFCDFPTVLEQLELNADLSYLVIVTRGHKSDLLVLRQALQRELKYVGMIGSKQKVKLLLEELRKEGLPEETLEQVHAPIGLPIGADTLEEIAISIAAELIQVRRTKDPK